MSRNDPTGAVRSLTMTLRPFGGRNSDADPQTIQDQDASGGSNWRIVRGDLRRRPSMSRIGMGTTLAAPVYSSGFHNTVHAFTSHDSDLNGEALLYVGRGGVFRLYRPRLMATYSQGTVSLSTGSRTMAGTGTAFLARGLHPGGSITQGSQVLEIRSITSNTSIQLVSAPSTGGTGLSYVADVWGTNDISESENTLEITNAAARILTSNGNTIAAGGVIVRNTNQSFHPGSFTVTRGSKSVTAPSSGAAQAIGSGTWLFFPNDVGSEATGVNTASHRRGYLTVAREGTTLTISEPFRGTSGAGSGGVYVHDGWLPLMADAEAGTPSDNYHYAVVEVSQSNLVSVTQGSSIIGAPAGYNFLRRGFQVGDQCRLSQFVFSITAINATTLGTSAPIDIPSDTGIAPVFRYFRQIQFTDADSMSQTLTSGTLRAAVQSQSGGTVFFYPYLWAIGDDPSRRTQIIEGARPSTYNSDPALAGWTGVFFLCTRTSRNDVRHNVWIGYPRQFNEFTLAPVSTAFPLARMIEYWEGRLFYADFRELHTDGASFIERPYGIGWTRVDEPGAFWNFYPTDGAGTDIFDDGRGRLRALKKIVGGNQSMVIYKDWGILQLFPTGDSSNPFRRRYLDTGPGPCDVHAIIPWRGGHAYMGTDARFYVFDGERVNPLPCTISDHVRANINDAYVHWSVGVHNIQDNELAWFYPTLTGGGQGTLLTQAAVWNYRYDTWYLWDFSSHPLTAISYIDTMEDRRINAYVAADMQGNILQFRDGPGIDFNASIGGGSLFTTQWVSKEFSLPVPNVDTEERQKIVTGVEPVYDPTYSGRLQVEVSGDGGINWTNFGILTLTSGATAGTSHGLGNAFIAARTHMVRLTQTPANTTSDSSMSIRALKIHYRDYGEVGR